MTFRDPRLGIFRKCRLAVAEKSHCTSCPSSCTVSAGGQHQWSSSGENCVGAVPRHRIANDKELLPAICHRRHGQEHRSIAESLLNWGFVKESLVDHISTLSAPETRATERGFGHPSKGLPAKNLYTKSERLTLSCRVTWAWSERVSLYNRQIIILLRKTKTVLPGPGNFYQPPSPLPFIGTARNDFSFCLVPNICATFVHYIPFWFAMFRFTLI
jgi:hypothetical protein